MKLRRWIVNIFLLRPSHHNDLNFVDGFRYQPTLDEENIN